MKTKKIAKELNPYLANLGVMYIKLHNVHWNVVGKNFKEIHVHTEEIYDDITIKLDDVAETIKMNGEYPIASLKEMVANATLEEIDSADISEKDGIELVLNDLKTLREQAISIRENLSEKDAFTSVMLLEDHVSYYDKEIWFLGTMIKKINN